MRRFVPARGRRRLVTGCAGFLGSSVAEALLAEGHEVVGVDCFTDFYDRGVKEHNLLPLLDDEAFTFHEVDLSAAPLGEILDGVEVIYHLAGQPGVRESFGANLGTYLRNNVLASSRLMSEAARRPLQRFVYASSSTVYGDARATPTPETAPRRPLSPYGVTKVMTEELARSAFVRHGMPVVGMRFFSAYGPRQRPDLVVERLIAAALDDAVMTIHGDGHQSRDFTYVSDVVDATIAAGESGTPGATYNIGGGQPAELLDVIRTVESLSGRTLRCRFGRPAPGDARSTSADCTRARIDLGYEPGTPLAEGLAAQFAASCAARSRPAYSLAA